MKTLPNCIPGQLSVAVIWNVRITELVILTGRCISREDSCARINSMCRSEVADESSVPHINQYKKHKRER